MLKQSSLGGSARRALPVACGARAKRGSTLGGELRVEARCHPCCLHFRGFFLLKIPPGYTPLRNACYPLPRNLLTR